MDLTKHSTAQPITCQPLRKQYVKILNHFKSVRKFNPCLYYN